MAMPDAPRTTPLEEDQRLQQAIRVGNIGIFEHDHVADVIYWSAELRRMYGWTLEEPATLPKIIAQAHPDDAPRIIAAVRAAHDPNGEGYFDIEHRIISRQGDVRWLSTRSRTQFETYAGARRPYRTIGAVQDITERRTAEQRLRVLEAQLNHAQKLESIGRLAGSIAHDFNNILTVISGSLEVGRATLPAAHASRESLDVAVEATRSATTLTKQLLAFSRREAIEPRAFDFDEVLQRVRGMLVRLLGDGIQLRTRVDHGLPALWFDPGQLEQIILNLAVNARDAMARGGKLTIEAASRRVDERDAASQVDARKGDYVMLTVSDDGVGIAPEVREHLFEPFFTSKEIGKGTGLGLAVVYGAVKQHGGWLEVESELGQGTTFRIFLPTACAQGSAPC
jgi:PAS domain S-box-containing protein